jgi:hypothetical protein
VALNTINPIKQFVHILFATKLFSAFLYKIQTSTNYKKIILKLLVTVPVAPGRTDTTLSVVRGIIHIKNIILE